MDSYLRIYGILWIRQFAYILFLDFYEIFIKIIDEHIWKGDECRNYPK